MPIPISFVILLSLHHHAHNHLYPLIPHTQHLQVHFCFILWVFNLHVAYPRFIKVQKQFAFKPRLYFAFSLKVMWTPFLSWIVQRGGYQVPEFFFDMFSIPISFMYKSGRLPPAGMLQGQFPDPKKPTSCFRSLQHSLCRLRGNRIWGRSLLHTRWHRKIQIQAWKWRPDRQSRQWLGCGEWRRRKEQMVVMGYDADLFNLGSTYYVNPTVQCLYLVPKLKSSLISEFNENIKLVGHMRF